MKELLDKYVGKKAKLTINSLTFDVQIVDFKNSYGTDRVRVKPVAGTGETWVNLDSVKLS